MVAYKKVIKITYCLLIAGMLFVTYLLWKQRALNGNYGQFTVLVVVFVFLIYGGINVRRLLKVGADEKDIITYMKHNDMEYWSKCYAEIKEYQNKISYIRHDLANHIQVLDALKEAMGCEYSKEKLKHIVNKLEEISAVKYCDNMLVDIGIEQKIMKLRKKGIIVDADICLRGVREWDGEKLCLLIWMIFDKMAYSVENGEKLNITINNHKKTKDGYVMEWCIISGEKPRGLYNLKAIVKSMDGSMMIERKGQDYLMIGMVEVKDKLVESID